MDGGETKPSNEESTETVQNAENVAQKEETIVTNNESNEIKDAEEPPLVREVEASTASLNLNEGEENLEEKKEDTEEKKESKSDWASQIEESEKKKEEEMAAAVAAETTTAEASKTAASNVKETDDDSDDDQYEDIEDDQEHASGRAEKLKSDEIKDEKNEDESSHEKKSDSKAETEAVKHEIKPPKQQRQQAAQPRKRQQIRDGRAGRRPQGQKVDPSVIPRKPYFFEHDDRKGEDEDNEKDEKVGGGGGGEASQADGDRDTSETQENTESGQNDGSKKEAAITTAIVNDIDSTTATRHASANSSRGAPYQDYGRKRRAHGGRFQRRGPMNNVDADSAENEGERWTHDRFDPNEQLPKSKDEIVRKYGYDIRESAHIPPQLEKQQQTKTSKGKQRQSQRDSGSGGRQVAVAAKPTSNNKNNSDTSRSTRNQPAASIAAVANTNTYVDNNNQQARNSQPSKAPRPRQVIGNY